MDRIQIRKMAVSAITGAMLIAAAPTAQAVAIVQSTFNVDITLTSACSVSTPANLTFAYTALQTTAATASSTFSVTCANGLPYNVGVSGQSVTDSVVGLAYSLVVTPPVGGGTGTGSAQSYSIDGTIASGQAGTCISASCTNAGSTNSSKIVTVTY